MEAALGVSATDQQACGLDGIEADSGGSLTSASLEEFYSLRSPLDLRLQASSVDLQFQIQIHMRLSGGLQAFDLD